ncbi:MAG: hypothetical protein JNJ78_20320 [Anaerolineae bacterium]|nr:hypothetical protein [Anaerolineae bacterium]
MAKKMTPVPAQQTDPDVTVAQPQAVEPVPALDAAVPGADATVVQVVDLTAETGDDAAAADEPEFVEVQRVTVREYYIGYRSNEQMIKPGEYDIDDPALFGLAAYLVELGKADFQPTFKVPVASVPRRTPRVVEQLDYNGRRLEVTEGDAE